MNTPPALELSAPRWIVNPRNTAPRGSPFVNATTDPARFPSITSRLRASREGGAKRWREGRPDQKPPQNVYLREIGISRLFCRVLLMMPKFELPSVPLGFPHCGVLKALNASHRNCSCRPFCTENDLASERSTTFSPGPTTGFRAELP